MTLIKLKGLWCSFRWVYTNSYAETVNYLQASAWNPLAHESNLNVEQTASRTMKRAMWDINFWDQIWFQLSSLLNISNVQLVWIPETNSSLTCPRKDWAISQACPQVQWTLLYLLPCWSFLLSSLDDFQRFMSHACWGLGTHISTNTCLKTLLYREIQSKIQKLANDPYD